HGRISKEGRQMSSTSFDVEPSPAAIARDESVRPELRALIAAAARAPSGDNMQPWRLIENCSERLIEVYIDTNRDTSPMNSGQRMSLVACGAAIENALLLAQERGWQAELELPDELLNIHHSLLIARIRLGSRTAQTSPENYSRLIAERVVNRRPYDARPVSPIILSDLERSTPNLSGIATHWIDDRGFIDQL